jgi:hypothetical protein
VRGSWTLSLPVLLIVMMILSAGCITTPQGGDDDELARDITLIIDFEDFDPDTHSGQRVEWKLDVGGEWVKVLEDRTEGAYYVINNLTALNALDVLRAADLATGIPIEHHVESMGAFVDSIDGVVNGRDGHYWSYYINGEYGLVSADSADLDDGDEVRWLFMGNPFG